MNQKFLDRMLQMQVNSGITKVGDVTCSYEVISRDFEPRLPNFVGIIDAEKHYYFISEEVPAEFRHAVIAHEEICTRGKKDRFGNVRTGHCLEALSAEIKLIPEANQPEYIRMRRKFFDDLVDFSKNSKDAHFLEEIRSCQDFLHCLKV